MALSNATDSATTGPDRGRGSEGDLGFGPLRIPDSLGVSHKAARIPGAKAGRNLREAWREGATLPDAARGGGAQARPRRSPGGAPGSASAPVSVGPRAH